MTIRLWALGLLLAASGCYTGNPPWPNDPTQPSLRQRPGDGGAPDGHGADPRH